MREALSTPPPQKKRSFEDCWREGKQRVPSTVSSRRERCMRSWRNLLAAFRRSYDGASRTSSYVALREQPPLNLEDARVDADRSHYL